MNDDLAHDARQLVASFVVTGEPVSKSRARFTKRGSKTFAYTPQKTLDGEKAVKDAFLEAASEIPMDDDLIYSVRAEFFSGTRQRRDVDNMVKLILDGLNKVAWPDDNQVVEIAAKKHWVLRDDARTEVSVYVVGTMDPPTQPCIHCGTPFRTYESWKNKPGAKKFCSRECGYQYRMDQRERTCKHCAKTFFRWGESKETIYCSIECTSANKRATVECSHCGNSFTKQRCHVRAVNYCSTECKTGGAKKRRTKNFPGTCETCGGGTTRKEYTRCQPCKSATQGVSGKPR